jgi:hypothetical protein
MPRDNPSLRARDRSIAMLAALGLRPGHIAPLVGVCTESVSRRLQVARVQAMIEQAQEQMGQECVRLFAAHMEAVRRGKRTGNAPDGQVDTRNPQALFTSPLGAPLGTGPGLPGAFAELLPQGHV